MPRGRHPPRHPPSESEERPTRAHRPAWQDRRNELPADGATHAALVSEVTGSWTAACRRARLHVVTGKGGTGKTTVAAALALALASEGRRVLLVEVEERQGIARLFDVPPLPYEERKVAVASGGGEVRGLCIDVEAALLEYFQMFYNLGIAGRSLRKLGAIEFATTLAPGLRDVLLTGKVKETVTRIGKDHHPVYDAVVMDAPPTGRVVTFLSVTQAMSGLAKRGPIHSQAEGVVQLLHSPDTVVHLVTLLEDMPVTETLEAVEQMREAGLPVGTIVVNAVTESPLPADLVPAAASGELDRNEIVAELRSVGLTTGRSQAAVTALVDGLLEQTSEQAIRVIDEARCREALEDTGLPLLTLPRLVEGGDLAGVYELTERLTEQGVR